MRKLALALVSVPLALTTLAHADDKQTCNDAYQAAQSLRLQHKLLESRDQLRTCNAQTCPAYQQKDCGQWFGEVEAAIPSVVLSAKDGDGNPLANVTVALDGQPLAASLGTSVDVDPGSHTFSFTTADGTKVDKTFLVVEAQKDQQVSVTIGQPTAPPPKPATTADGGTTTTATPAPAPSYTGAWIAMGVGAGGLVVGSIFGILALGNKSTLSSKCSSMTTCPSSEQGDINSLGTNAVVSDIGFGVGIVGVGIGTYLFLSHRSSSAPAQSSGAAVQVTPYFAGNGAGLSGTFQ